MMLKITAAAICAVICALLVKGKNPHIAFMISAAGCIVILAMLLSRLSWLFSACKNLIALSGVEPDVFHPLSKCVGIAVCTRITAELCRDSGERALGAKIELAGAAAGMICAFPLVEKAMSVIEAI